MSFPFRGSFISQVCSRFTPASLFSSFLFLYPYFQVKLTYVLIFFSFSSQHHRKSPLKHLKNHLKKLEECQGCFVTSKVAKSKYVYPISTWAVALKSFCRHRPPVTYNLTVLVNLPETNRFFSKLLWTCKVKELDRSHCHTLHRMYSE